MVVTQCVELMRKITSELDLTDHADAPEFGCTGDHEVAHSNIHREGDFALPSWQMHDIFNIIIFFTIFIYSISQMDSHTCLPYSCYCTICFKGCFIREVIPFDIISKWPSTISMLEIKRRLFLPFLVLWMGETWPDRSFIRLSVRLLVRSFVDPSVRRSVCPNIPAFSRIMDGGDLA